MCSAHFLPFYEKSVEETQLHGYFRIFQPSAISLRAVSPHFLFLVEVKLVAQCAPLPRQIHAFLSNRDLRALFTLSWKLIRRLLFCIRIASCRANWS